MNIGAIAKITGLSHKSIRLYEEKGLITPPARSAAGYREYSRTQVTELNLIARAKNAGFSLKECRDLVQLTHDPHFQSRAVKTRAEQKLSEVEEKIRHLEEIRQQLQQWVSACPGDDSNDCPIINDMTKQCSHCK